MAWLAGYVIGSILVATSTLLAVWLASQIWKIENLSWRRAVGGAAIVAAALLLGGLALFTRWPVALSPGWPAVKTLLMVAVLAGLTVVGLRRALRTSLARACGVGLTALVVQAFCTVLCGLLLLPLGAALQVLHLFVVPTGAMAPMIHGAHIQPTCPNCKKSFAVNASDRAVPGLAPSRQGEARCPQCYEMIPLPLAMSLRSGNRVVADKVSQARRWDCVVFRYPLDRNVYYVKRLVGLPGETVDIAGGEIFINGALARKGPFEVLDAWLPVYDSLFTPASAGPHTPGWESEREARHWKDEAGKGWTFDGDDSDAEALAFTGQVDDSFEYNPVDSEAAGAGDDTPPFPVGDVRLVCALDSFSGAGKLQWKWNFCGQTLEFDVDPQGRAKVNGRAESELPELPDPPAEAVSPPVRRIEFAVRDETAYVVVNGRLATRVELPSEEFQRDSTARPAACYLQLIADHCRLRISRLELFRDRYYLPVAAMKNDPASGMESIDLPIELGDDGCLMLGDNVRRSADGRFFGPVPRSDIVGVVRGIYWPPGRWHVFQ